MTVTVVETPTVPAATVALPVAWPAATVMLAGGLKAEVLLLLRVTTAPPEGANPVSVTVTVALFVLITVDGLIVTEFSTGLIVYAALAIALSIHPLS
jgi:hypothetical protein